MGTIHAGDYMVSCYFLTLSLSSLGSLLSESVDYQLHAFVSSEISFWKCVYAIIYTTSMLNL